MLITMMTDQKNAKYEIRLSNLPDGAYTEDYLGHSRYCETRKEADAVVRQFEASKKARPSDFETESGDMTAQIVGL